MGVRSLNHDMDPRHSQGESAAGPRRRTHLPGWIGVALAIGLTVPASAPAANPHLLPPLLHADGRLELRVAGPAPFPLTAEQAERITILHSPHLTPDLEGWAPVQGSRVFHAGMLHVDWLTAGDSPATRFFVAQELATPQTLTVSTAAAFRSAVANARPGTRIQLAAGTYPGGFAFSNLRGMPGHPIVLAGADPAQPPVLQGGANAIQLTDPSWVVIEDLVLTGATGNGLNIDDGGTADTPAQHITLRRLRVTDVGPQGNRDGIKLSGVVDFRVEGCTIERWGSAGSGIDMVGCHRGLIESNQFRHTPAAASTGANGVQTKGGSSDVIVRRNRFEHAGARSVNVGGSTGLEFFRPALMPGGNHAEARAIRVEGNTIIGSTAAIAFVGVDGAVVRFNTLYRPERWAIRILQENTAPGFVPCRDGVFTDNLVAFHSSQWSSGGVNVGAQTSPETFQFARNGWYCIDTPARSRPSLPTPETSGTYGQDPRFRDPTNGDLRLQPDSPARAMGAEALP